MMTMTRQTPSTVRTADASDAGPLRNRDATGTPWGAFRILLVADRVPSLRAGSTHKVYRDWRFAAVMQHGHPQSGTTVFTVPVDPGRLATSRSRYALVQLTTSEAMTSFSWSISKIGTADPFAEAQTRAQRRLEGTGWTQDAVVLTRYAKSDPSVPSGEAAATPSPADIAHPAVPEDAIAPGVFESAHLRAAAPPPEITGLDEWEMDGGA